INADFYYLGFYNPSASYTKQPHRARETRHSIGIRLFGKLFEAVDFDAETIYQFGTYGSYTIHAFEVDGKIWKEFRMKNGVLKPAVKFGYASGNRSLNDSRLNTFNPLFPNLLYYQTAIGIFPANIINPNASLTWSARKMALAGGLDFFWRASKQDGLYAPFGTIEFIIGNSTYLGHQLYTKGDYQFTPHLSATVLVSRYYKSDFVKMNVDRRGIDLLLNVLLNCKL
ncbi:alginate export family protein, partial [Flavitalea antarctica]